MKTRMQFCPVCQKQTSHTYQPVSWLWFIFWLIVFFPVALIYLVIAIPRENRTAQCTVDHEALRMARENEQLRSMVLAMQMNSGRVEPPPRGTGFMK
ncbi:hypothetical protein [Paraburkholderia susongensis]|uniref:Uncharacterized protein n=1 Tax=Paraburkholderia susongensis TaxID=1515439 RepID=A0A1X7I5N8_9BURK|nr:hypothetical protein [Paraburkholderia susongensis]SMG09783.1 hypothetical protein SAMN06265784_101344 [Paraburkholderia susongensis]